MWGWVGVLLAPLPSGSLTDPANRTKFLLCCWIVEHPFLVSPSGVSSGCGYSLALWNSPSNCTLFQKPPQKIRIMKNPACKGGVLHSLGALKTLPESVRVKKEVQLELNLAEIMESLGDSLTKQEFMASLLRKQPEFAKR